MQNQGIIYHTYSPENVLPDNQQKHGKTRTFVAKSLEKASLVLFILGLIVAIISFGPSLFFQITQGAGEKFAKILAFTKKPSEIKNTKKVDDTYEPRFDPKLSKVNTIKVPKIGLISEIYEAPNEDFESALKKGPWRVPDFGTPADRTYPTIIAAHRFGYLAWSNLYRRQHSFYNLPKLNKGEIVEIVWKQRKYIYEIYAQGKGKEIEDYSADLVLYTCETLNAETKIFVYARLMRI